MATTAKDPSAEQGQTDTTEGEVRRDAKVTFESVMPREEAVSYFEAIVAGLKSGALRVRQAEETVVLTPPDQVAIEVKAVRKGQKEKILFEIAWRVSSPADLTISAD
jgi:amphi-Trp domain-containing protein